MTCKRSCPAYGNYQPPYADCTCGAEATEETPVRNVKESCSEGAVAANANSAQPCGCDPGAHHVCAWHTNQAHEAGIAKAQALRQATAARAVLTADVDNTDARKATLPYLEDAYDAQKRAIRQELESHLNQMTEPKWLVPSADPRIKLGKVVTDVVMEFFKASESNQKFNSLHEGYAVLLEEMDELKAEVWKNARKHPDRNELARKEAIQVAAMALRLLMDVL